ncbi:MAG: OmpH family outer membrane protein [Fimbriimonas sp.]
MRNTDKLGWIIAALMAGFMVGTGFQGQAIKVGTVDLEKVFNDSEYVKKQNEGLRALGQTRQDILEFVAANKTMKPEDAAKFRDLSLKTTPTAEDKAALEKLKADAVASDRRFRELQTKANATDAEQALLREFNQRNQAAPAMLQRWEQEFSTELRDTQDKLRVESLSRAKDAVRQVAAKDGFSVIFAEQVAPYSANDVTDSSLKAMNTKK